MAPPTASQTLLSPAELSFLHSSLALDPPSRPDLRTSTQFRPLVAETDILGATNGSARVCFSDGTEAIVGIKAELEKTLQAKRSLARTRPGVPTDKDGDVGMSEDKPSNGATDETPAGADVGRISDAWLEVSIEIPGYRDDDNLPVFLGSMITETLLAEDTLKAKLYINARWHWKLYIDVLLLSSPLSYPLPLLSLTTHLALLNAKLPRLTSELEDDPMFDDDWAAAEALYPPNATDSTRRPPVTLLVMTVAENIIFDPSEEELAVADAVLAVSVIPTADGVKLLAIRTIDPPSRLTPPGIPDSVNPATSGAQVSNSGGVTAAGNAGAPTNIAQEMLAEREKGNVWTPPRGGMKRATVSRIIKMVVERGGVGEEVVAGLAGVET